MISKSKLEVEVKQVELMVHEYLAQPGLFSSLLNANPYKITSGNYHVAGYLRRNSKAPVRWINVCWGQEIIFACEMVDNQLTAEQMGELLESHSLWFHYLALNEIVFYDTKDDVPWHYTRTEPLKLWEGKFVYDLGVSVLDSDKRVLVVCTDDGIEAGRVLVNMHNHDAGKVIELYNSTLKYRH